MKDADCSHREKYMDRFGREVWRACPYPPVEVVEGCAFCELHLPPGPKVA